jgi:hypothetical protein
LFHYYLNPSQERSRVTAKCFAIQRLCWRRTSRYLLSGGLFRCSRCGANMIGFHTDGRFYYVCGSQPYRSGTGCGPGVYVPQAQVESEVLSGLRGVLDLCADPQKFTRAVNKKLRQIWQASTNFRPDAGERIAAIDRNVERTSAVPSRRG